MEDNIPHEFKDSINLLVMSEPIINEHNQIYEKETYEQRLLRAGRDPLTNLALKKPKQFTNVDYLKYKIDNFVKENYLISLEDDLLYFPQSAKNRILKIINEEKDCKELNEFLKRYGIEIFKYLNGIKKESINLTNDLVECFVKYLLHIKHLDNYCFVKLINYCNNFLCGGVTPSDGNFVLFICLKYNLIEIIKKHELNCKEIIKYNSIMETTPLILAIENNSTEIIEYLLPIYNSNLILLHQRFYRHEVFEGNTLSYEIDALSAAFSVNNIELAERLITQYKFNTKHSPETIFFTLIKKLNLQCFESSSINISVSLLKGIKVFKSKNKNVLHYLGEAGNYGFLKSVMTKCDKEDALILMEQDDDGNTPLHSICKNLNLFPTENRKDILLMLSNLCQNHDYMYEGFFVKNYNEKTLFDYLPRQIASRLRIHAMRCKNQQSLKQRKEMEDLKRKVVEAEHQIKEVHELKRTISEMKGQMTFMSNELKKVKMEYVWVGPHFKETKIGSLDLDEMF
ncbi:hypothetical protein ABK040_005064 [Willaertia magna]